MLARNLGMTVIAEGVETAEQDIILHEMDCALAQGWFYSRAMDVKGVERLVSFLERRLSFSGSGI
jgi:sensor c-di-GMP phosphodiesterase-like protein